MGDLAQQDIDTIKEMFADDADISAIARTLKQNPKEIRKALSDPEVASDALYMKQKLYAVELVGLAFDRLATLIRDGEPQHFLQATRLLHTLTSTDWLPQQRGKQKEEEKDITDIAGLLGELDGELEE
jgi:hypothetical protein